MKKLLISISIVLFATTCESPSEPENFDTSPPNVVIQTPFSNAVIADVVLISVFSQDNEGVSEVKFYINNTLYFTDTQSPYEFSWDTNEESNGEYEIKIISFDISGNESEPFIINVNVLNTVDSSEICNNQYSNIDGSLITCDEDCFESGEECYHLNDLSALDAFQQAFEALNALTLLEIGNQVWENGRLISLNLTNVGLSGELPGEISYFTALQSLYLGYNNLSGIPESICNLELTNLTLYYNQLCNGNNYPECVIDYVNCYGCIDDTACNYDEFATDNEGCEYPITVDYDCNGNCLNDADSDGICINNDADSYGTVVIGNQIWMTENLRVTHYRNGDEIPTGYSNWEWQNLINSGAYAISHNDITNVDVYGNLYNWYAVFDNRGLCPEGWHVPSDDEYRVLTDFLGGESVAGGKMKETGHEHWNYWNDQISSEATNESGFTGFPAGYRAHYSGAYGDLGNEGCFWSSTSSSTYYSYGRILYYNSSEINGDHYDSRLGFSVRCLKD